MSKLYEYIALSLMMTVFGFFVGLAFVPYTIVAMANALLAVFLLIALIIAFIVKCMKKDRLIPLRFPIAVVYIFAFIEGVTLYPIILFYLAELGVPLFLSIVVGTMAVFGVLAAIGHKAEDGSFVGLGKTLGVVLLVMIIVSLVNLLIQSDIICILLSAAGVLVFSAYIAVDIVQFKTAYNAGYIHDSKDYSIFVLNIYLDIINLLLDILRLVRKIKD